MLALMQGVQAGDRFRLVQGAILLLAAPFLLFPSASVPATMAAATAVTLFWVVMLWGRFRAYLPFTPLNLPLLLLAGTVFVGILASADPEETSPKAFGLVLGLGAWLYVARADLRGRGADRWAVFYLLVGLAFLGVGALTTRWFVKYSLLEPLVALVGQAGVPALGANTHPNQVAGTILLFLPLPAAYLLLDRRLASQSRAMLSVLTLGVLALLLLTQSRSGWLGAAGGLGLVGLFWLAERARVSRRVTLTAASLLLGGLAGLALLIAGSGLPFPALDGAAAAAGDPLSALSIRQEVWTAARAALADFPVTGAGLGAFRAVVFRYYPLGISPTIDIAHAHNVFLQTALDVGWPGLVAYVALLMSAAASGWRAAAGDKRLRPLAAGLLGSLAAYHLFGLTDALALGAKPALLLWLVFGLLAALSRMSGVQPGSESSA